MGECRTYSCVKAASDCWLLERAVGVGVQGWPEAKLGLGVKPGVNNTRQTTEHTQTRLPEILISSLRVIVTRLSLCSSLGICDWGRCTWPAKIRRLDAVSSSAGLGPHKQLFESADLGAQQGPRAAVQRALPTRCLSRRAGTAHPKWGDAGAETLLGCGSRDMLGSTLTDSTIVSAIPSLGQAEAHICAASGLASGPRRRLWCVPRARCRGVACGGSWAPCTGKNCLSGQHFLNATSRECITNILANGCCRSPGAELRSRKLVPQRSFALARCFSTACKSTRTTIFAARNGARNGKQSKVFCEK